MFQSNDLMNLIGHFDLQLPSSLYLTLNNMCLITSITRNIVSVSCLRKSSFIFQFVDDNIHSFLDGDAIWSISMA